MAERSSRTPEDTARELYEQAESQTAEALEQLVSKQSFGVVFARGAENVAALARVGTDLADLVLRNLRVAGRADITRLARQLHRTEDKLERVLQEVEELRDELAARELKAGEASSNGSSKDAAEGPREAPRAGDTGAAGR
jgi:hypothetical protein